jgi:TetR/AcrR family acrAB operon transcriptional repressor
MARKTKEEARQTRSRILAIALDLFARKGYAQTTFTDIADKLDLTKGAVYWHFKSKESLLMALVDAMLEKFKHQLAAELPDEELTFPAVARIMIANARRILGDPRGIAFFMLMKTQVRWQSDSMARVRDYLLSDRPESPYHVFRRAVENDRARGLVRADVDPTAVASVSLAVWDGIVRARIDGFLACEIEPTLEMAYAAIWEGLRADEGRTRLFNTTKG